MQQLQRVRVEVASNEKKQPRHAPLRGRLAPSPSAATDGGDP